MPQKKPKRTHKFSAKRTPFEIQRDRVVITDLYLKGNTQFEIARKLSISRDMVQHDLQRVREEWLQARVFDFNEAKTKALAELDHLKVVAWDAWERSKKGKTKTSQSETRPAAKSKGAGEIVATLAKEETYGDPRFLQQVKEVISEQSKLLGLYPDTAKLSAGLPEGAAAQASVVYLPAFEPPKPRPAGITAAQN